MPQGSKIFLPNRALGYVSNHIPLQVRYIKTRKENLITTSVGKLFHTYGISHFALLSVSGLHHEDITCMSTDAYHVYTACDATIYAWRRGTELKHTYRGHGAPVHLLMPFGAHLLSVDEANLLRVWDIKTEELFLELQFSSASFKVTALLHPSTYLNKVLLGSEQGGLQLWNVNTSKLIYTFAGWAAPVTCLEQAPAIDVVAVGLANGRIILHNLRYDKTVLEFTQDWGYVTALSFRTDGHPILASGTLAGHIVFWHLEERRVHTQLMAAHGAAVSGLHCLANEPLLVTSSPDNTLKLWIFDMTDGGARLLRIREGHSAPPTCIRFHGASGQNVLSAGADASLRVFNTLTETFNKSLGRASYNRAASKRRGRTAHDPLRMPPILQFTAETTREKEWDNIAAVHQGIPTVTTWSYDRLTMGDHKLLPARLQRKKRAVNVPVAATSVCLTHCGHFVLVGYSTGDVDRFNVQSGVHRDTYGTPRAHSTPVRGVCVDALNSVVMSAASDASVKFWPFQGNGAKARTKLLLDEPVSFVRAHRDSSLVAVALEDFSVHMLDVDTRTIVRKFHGHTAQLTDATFSPDARWLVTAAMDCTVRTWSIPAGQLVDQFRLEAACTSLTLSPTGELLATAHVDSLGVFLWSNRTLYSHVTLKALPEGSEPPLVSLPECSRAHELDAEAESDVEPVEFKSPEQINRELVTLSNVASSRWQNLLHIDVIRQRNKPRAPPKAPAAAPFFLPTVPSLTLQFDLEADAPKATDSRLLAPVSFVNFSPFGRLLDATVASGSFAAVIDKLKSMGPSMVDFEIRLLGPEEGGSVSVMLQFLKCVESMFQANRDFELAQAYLAVFLKVHGNTVATEPALIDYLPNIQSCQTAGWARLQSKLFYSLCVIQSLKAM